MVADAGLLKAANDFIKESKKQPGFCSALLDISADNN
jgi:hypothetical protein